MNVAIAAEAPTEMWDPNARQKTSCIERTTDPFTEYVCYAEGAPSTSVKRSLPEEKYALLRSSQEEDANTTTLEYWCTTFQVGNKYSQYKSGILQLLASCDMCGWV